MKPSAAADRELPSDGPPHGAPPRAVLIAVLSLSVLGVSGAGPLVRASSVDEFALAFWRMLLSAALTGTLWLGTELGAAAAARRAGGAPAADGGAGPAWREVPVALLAGAFLAVHFATWFVAVRRTSVAEAGALVSTMAVFSALVAAALLGERPGRRGWAGVALAVAGATVIAGPDFHRSVAPGRAGGHMLALAGAFAGALYFVCGRGIRRRVSLWSYVTKVYATAAAVLLAVALVSGAPLAVPSGREWAIVILLVLAPTLLGHTLLNWALRYLPAHAVNAVVLGEPVGAAILAGFVFGEWPGARAIVGGSILLLGIGLVLRRSPAAG